MSRAGGKARLLRSVGYGALLLGPLLVVWGLMIRMPGDPGGGELAALDARGEATRWRLRTDVAVVAGEIGPRNRDHPEALEAAAEHVLRRLGEAGYEPRSLPYASRGGEWRNVEAELPGGELAHEVVVLGAHYDSYGDTPGADDNASGVAVLLELARRLRDAHPDRTVRFVAFTNEEPPFFDEDDMGSRVYARETAERGDDVVAMISLETMGYFLPEPGSQRYPFPFSLFYPDRGDFVAFVGNLDSRPLVHRTVRTFREGGELPSEGVAAPASLPGMAWSDHASFWLHGYPAVMISDTAPFRNQHYHTVLDTPDRLDYGRLARVVDGVERVVRELAGAGT